MMRLPWQAQRRLGSIESWFHLCLSIRSALTVPIISADAFDLDQPSFAPTANACHRTADAAAVAREVTVVPWEWWALIAVGMVGLNYLAVAVCRMGCDN